MNGKNLRYMLLGGCPLKEWLGLALHAIGRMPTEGMVRTCATCYWEDAH